MDKRRPTGRPGGKGSSPKGGAPFGPRTGAPKGAATDRPAPARSGKPAPDRAKAPPAKGGRPPRPAFPQATQAPRPAPEAAPRPREHGREAGLWLYGHHPVIAALQNQGRRCHRLLVTAAHPDDVDPELARAAEARDLFVEIVPREVLDKALPAGAVHQGIALKVDPLEELGLDEVCTRELDERAIVVVLDQVTDPHNVGAIMRSAAAFGARAVVVTDRHAPGATAVMAKAASGALDVIPLIRVTNLARALDSLGELGYWRVALDADAPETLARTATTGSIALVLGAEGPGLRRLTRERCDVMAKLPIGGGVESLNVSNAAAIALYELIRDN